MKPEPIKANQDLGKTPKVGNLISEEYFGPLLSIGLIAFIASLCGVPVRYCVGFVLWVGGGWLLWAGKKPYLQIAKLLKKKPNWATARIKYQPKENIRLRKK